MSDFDDANDLGDASEEEEEGGGLMGLDLGGLLDQFQRVQDAQAASFEGQSGGGAVRITATGAGEFRSVTIQPSAVDPDDVEMLQDLVLAALHDLGSQIADAQREALGNFDLGNLGGLLGDFGPQG